MDADHWKGYEFERPERSEGGVGLCGSCRRTRQCRLGIHTEHLTEDDTLRCEVACGEEYEGGPGVAHGGWTAAVLDEVLGHIAPFFGVIAVTGTLQVKYLKPVPIGRQLIATARVDQRVGNKWHISGELTLAAGGATLAVANGVWVQRPAEAHFAGFEEWLAEQDQAQPSLDRGPT